MRHSLTLAALAFLAFARPVLAAPLDMANGYGWIGASRDIDPAGLGEIFCQARISGDMQVVAPFYAEKLRLLLAAAPEASVPWQSFADRPADCAVSILNGYADTVGVLVQITYDAPARTWSDTLNLERTPESWRLNNVFYTGGGNLRFKLFGLAP